MPALFIGNGVCGSHHGLAATAAHSRKTGYIYATGIVIYDVADPCTDEADHTFFQEPPSADRLACSSPHTSVSIVTHILERIAQGKPAESMRSFDGLTQP